MSQAIDLSYIEKMRDSFIKKEVTIDVYDTSNNIIFQNLKCSEHRYSTIVDKEIHSISFDSKNTDKTATLGTGILKSPGEVRTYYVGFTPQIISPFCILHLQINVETPIFSKPKDKEIDYFSIIKSFS